MIDTLFKELFKTAVKEAIQEVMSSDTVKNLVVNTFNSSDKTPNAKVGEASDTKAKNAKKTKADAAAESANADGETGPAADQTEAETDTAKDTQPSIPTDHGSSLDAATLRAESLAIIDQLAPTHGRELRAALATFGAKRLSEVQDSDLPAFFAGLEALKNA